MARFFICAGEASADSYGAALAEELRRLSSQPIAVEGVGGARMRSAGVTLVLDSSSWGVVSIVQALRKVPRLLLHYQKIKASLTQSQPGVFVPIDYGYMNIRLARFAKSRGWKVLYFVPPGSWRRDRQGADLPAVTDAISTPFEWSAEILNRMGAKAHWFGHPIKQLLTHIVPEPRGSAIAVLPGSRGHEIEENLPLIAEVVRPLDTRLEFALAPGEDLSSFESKWRRVSGRSEDAFFSGQTAQVLLRCRASIVCSGTATLEAALCKCPMVVIYRLSKAMQTEIRLLRIKRPRFVALPNILLDREVVPELVDVDAQPDPVRQRLTDILQESSARRKQIEAFEKLDQAMGPNDAITRTAELALGIGAA